MTASTCHRCGQEIHFVRSMSRDGWIPLDVSPDPELGTVRKHYSGDGVSKKSRTVYAENLRGDELNQARADGERLWMRHADTCSAHRPYNPRPAHVQLNLPNRQPSHRK